MKAEHCFGAGIPQSHDPVFVSENDRVCGVIYDLLGKPLTGVFRHLGSSALLAPGLHLLGFASCS
jgi:hypothetical protein